MCEKCKGEGRYTVSPFPGIYTFEFCSCTPNVKADRTLDILQRRIEEFEANTKKAGVSF